MVYNLMARPKDQTQRRLTVISAAETMIAKQGLQGITLGSIANEAGMSANALLYYYSGLKGLLDDVQKQAVQRFCSQRAETVSQISDPKQRLLAMLRSGLPTGQDDQLRCSSARLPSISAFLKRGLPPACFI
jgi:DNA-binding transcriptional regulator YbjK